MESELIDSTNNRSSTDKSLKIERTKIDDYLDTEGSLEGKINQPLINKRADADTTLNKARSENDERISAEPKDINVILADERKNSDDAKNEARIFEDHLNNKKINENNSKINAFLDTERKDTDTKLSDERNEQDSKADDHHSSYDKVSKDLSIRDQYLATVSHDLKNPLSAIVLGTGAMKRSFLKGTVDRESFINYFELIERNAVIMQRLVNDLLDVEQMVNGAINLDLKECNMSKLLDEVKLCFDPVLSSLNLTLTLQQVNENICAFIDHDRIFQVLSNIIGNAIKFSPVNGNITISFDKTDENLSIKISDEGPGIPEDKKELIFERFTQLTANDSRGKGLGLFISKWIVESHDGDIFVETNNEKGSTFVISLPVSKSNIH